MDYVAGGRDRGTGEKGVEEEDERGLEISHDIFFFFFFKKYFNLPGFFFPPLQKKPRGAKIGNRRIKKSNFVPKSRSCVSDFFFSLLLDAFRFLLFAFPEYKTRGKTFYLFPWRCCCEVQKAKRQIPRIAKKEKEKEGMTATSVIKKSCSVLFFLSLFHSMAVVLRELTELHRRQEWRDEAKKETSLYSSSSSPFREIGICVVRWRGIRKEGEEAGGPSFLSHLVCIPSKKKTGKRTSTLFLNKYTPSFRGKSIKK